MSTDGFSVGGEEEGLTKKRMIQQSNLVIMLVDSTKILSDATAFFKFADYNHVNIIITDDSKLPGDFTPYIKQHKIKVI